MRKKELRYAQRIDLASEWVRKNPVLSPGEIGVEIEDGRFKMGDGVRTWVEITHYFLPDAAVLTMIQQYLDGLPSGEVTQQDLTDHIVDEEPHPAYDDLSSLSSYYRNRKATA